MLLDVIKDIAIICASIAAVYGVNSWRRESIGKRQIELCEEVLALFLECRDVIRNMRSPIGFAGEGSSRPTDKSESEEEKKIRDQAYVIVERYNNNREPFSRLYAIKYRFMAQFGSDKRFMFDELYKIVHELFVASRMLGDMRYHYRIGIQQKDAQDRLGRYENMIWEGMPGDEIQPKLDNLIREVEAICRKIISQRNLSAIQAASRTVKDGLEKLIINPLPSSWRHKRRE